MFKTGTRRHPPHARCRARPVGLPPYSAVHARRGRPATPGSFAVPTGSCAWYFWAQAVPRTAIACAGRPHRLQPLARRAARPMPLPPYRGHATAHTVACFLGAQEDLPAVLSLAIKAGHRPSRAGAQRCQATIVAVFVPTVNPCLRPLSPQTRAAPTSTRPPCSSHAR
jgi:hypothetical protein